MLTLLVWAFLPLFCNSHLLAETVTRNSFTFLCLGNLFILISFPCSCSILTFIIIRFEIYFGLAIAFEFLSDRQLISRLHIA
ncbi:MAG TPA: hypothetical protein VK211_28260 [Kamptonema sp.]|nr:hypothetical protein [Kamptonema sp.]